MVKFEFLIDVRSTGVNTWDSYLIFAVTPEGTTNTVTREVKFASFNANNQQQAYNKASMKVMERFLDSFTFIESFRKAEDLDPETNIVR